MNRNGQQSQSRRHRPWGGNRIVLEWRPRLIVLLLVLTLVVIALFAGYGDIGRLNWEW